MQAVKLTKGRSRETFTDVTWSVTVRGWIHSTLKSRKILTRTSDQLQTHTNLTLDRSITG